MTIEPTFGGGRHAGIEVGAELGLMAATWTMRALPGLNVVFDLFPAVYVGARIAGAAYLLYLANRIWRDASAPLEVQGEPARRAFRKGFLINLLNPKSVLFAAAVQAGHTHRATQLPSENLLTLPTTEVACQTRRDPIRS